MTDRTDWIPLFPLNTVLFPDGILPLKIFETRYMDMVRDCMKRDIPFGIVLIRSGEEVGQAADPEDVGCFAHIVNWDAPQLGLLMLRTKGGQRFRIIETRVCSDQHLEARVEYIAPDLPSAVTEQHASAARALQLIVQDITARGKEELGDAFESPFPDMSRFDDAGWVANRWSEVLPIPMKARQHLLALSDPLKRLSIVQQYLEQQNIL
ncbi:LON peptidase substrate-binding domain-containing protein [uncultured Oxalicibacterium sp.]|uniref:LON peptidase substrate-binding domain-containing protein n=1 Tax=uncultured Oxalicibacterium sp. TaxID=1168540 RepID=UPI0025D4A3D8|nr:LON peptidase substrate-binding domain-containing protein [uncultured Oxalicibacterium sp.]